MTFGEKLKNYRTREGLTQQELADRLFVTRAAVSKWERDLGYPGIDSLRLIAKAMDCTLDKLLSDEDGENVRRMEERRAKRMYVCAVAAFAAAVLFALLAYFLQQSLWLIGAGCGAAAYLVSNQSGIGRGYFPESGWHECHARLQELLAVFGAGFDDARDKRGGSGASCQCERIAGQGLLEAVTIK